MLLKHKRRCMSPILGLFYKLDLSDRHTSIYSIHYDPFDKLWIGILSGMYTYTDP